MRKLLILIALIALTVVALLATTGCASFNDLINGRDRSNYPSEIKGLCNQAYGQAKQEMINVGLSVANEPDCKVLLLPADGKDRGIWTHTHPKGRVAGLYYNGTIEIYYGNGNKSDIHYLALVHEFKHALCEANGYGLSHIRQLNWRL
jgi:hypothetical protein